MSVWIRAPPLKAFLNNKGPLLARHKLSPAIILTWQYFLDYKITFFELAVPHFLVEGLSHSGLITLSMAYNCHYLLIDKLCLIAHGSNPFNFIQLCFHEDTK